MVTASRLLGMVTERALIIRRAGRICPPILLNFPTIVAANKTEMKSTRIRAHCHVVAKFIVVVYTSYCTGELWLGQYLDSEEGYISLCTPIARYNIFLYKYIAFRYMPVVMKPCSGC